MSVVEKLEEKAEMTEMVETVEQDAETKGVRHLRVGIMSFAHVHAASYAALLRDDPTVTLVCADPDGAADVAAGDETRGRPFAEQLGVDYVDSYAELFAAGVDAVLVCSENTRHRELVELAAAHGAHVLCEKPLATTVADAEAMIAACDDAGVNLMVAYPVRFSPDFVSLREAYRSGQLGQIVIASGTNNGKIPVGARAWFGDPELAGGGCLVDHTVHVADLMDALMEAEPVSVYAVSNDILHRDKPEAKAETAGLVHVTYDNGVTLVVDASWSVPDNGPTWGGLTLDLVTDQTLVHIAPFAHAVTGVSAASQPSAFYTFGVNLDRLMLDEFFASIHEGRPAQPDGHAGLRTVKILDYTKA